MRRFRKFTPFFLALLAATTSGLPILARRVQLQTSSEDRTVFVHLFEWKWTDIERECKEWLGSKGYGAVQISPANEHRIIHRPLWNPNVEFPWYQRYQPVSYKLESRSGTRAELEDMIRTCNMEGVKVYADVVINHMSSVDAGKDIGIAGSEFNTNPPSYKLFDTDELRDEVWYKESDFHDNCNKDIDYKIAWEVQNCMLLGLQDLRTESHKVQQAIARYMNELIRIGVAGFRIDAAKHMAPRDIAAIVNQLDNLRADMHGPNKRPYIFHEVIYGKGEAVRPKNYVDNGNVTEFRYGTEIGQKFRYDKGDKISELRTFPGNPNAADWGLLASRDAVVFLDNHDNQRGHGSGSWKSNGEIDNILTNFYDERLYILGNVFMLAWPYGYPKVMSSYSWPINVQWVKKKNKYEDLNDWIGPPSDSGGNTKNVTCGSNGWVCEHRWRPIANMVGFRNYTQSSLNVTNWWDNGNNQIAFGRGNKGFVAINREKTQLKNSTFMTGLPAGEYCNVIQFDFDRSNNTCSGPGITVNTNGTATISVGAMDAVVLYGGARISGEAPGTISARFNVMATTKLERGEKIFLVGNIPQLGSWNTDNAVPLSAANYPNWEVTISLPQSVSVQYKYIKKDDAGNEIWEGGINRVLKSPSSGRTAHSDRWRS
ncbi:MAG: carbohydrate-binding module family 20 domain-containing protein [Xenococcaceae cyanobacterium]